MKHCQCRDVFPNLTFKALALQVPGGHFLFFFLQAAPSPALLLQGVCVHVRSSTSLSLSRSIIPFHSVNLPPLAFTVPHIIHHLSTTCCQTDGRRGDSRASVKCCLWTTTRLPLLELALARRRGDVTERPR